MNECGGYNVRLYIRVCGVIPGIFPLSSSFAEPDIQQWKADQAMEKRCFLSYQFFQVIVFIIQYLLLVVC